MKRIGLPRSPILWVIPTLAVMAFTIIVPMFYAMGVSFFRWELGEQLRFIGLDNYIRVLTNQDFQASTITTLTFTFVSFAIEFGLGFAIAFLLEEDFRGRGIFRAIFLLPMMIPPLVVGLLWKVLMNPTSGVLNYYIEQMGLAPPLWLSSTTTALWSMVLINVWEWTPFSALVLLAGLTALPKEPFEAARIDGAGRFQTFIHVTLPMMRYVIFVVALLRVMDDFKVFDIVYITTSGGPANASRVVSIDAYLNAFLFFHLGYTAAYTQMIFIMVTFMSFYIIKKAWPEAQKS